MKLTSKSRYAVTAMIDIALNQDQGVITLAIISERQGISLSYLEQIFASLKRQKLVTSVRGPGGGYRLNDAPENISVAQIINAVDDQSETVKCGSKGGCGQGAKCLSHDLWQALSLNIEQFLQDISLRDVLHPKNNSIIAEINFDTKPKGLA
jgi:Rrf2 family iron-sulfur cluster assembly transcriptional regulator